MKIKSGSWLGGAVVAAICAVVQPASSDPILRFPTFKAGETTFTIDKTNSHGLDIVTLFLPKGYTILVDPAVDDIVWQVSHIVVEEDTTIDLSRSYLKPAAKPPVAPLQGQAPKCKVGGFGGDGDIGVAGQAGHNLTFIGVETVENRGSLWIRTDGGPGGDGQTGGQGGQGGGPGRVNLIHCSAEPGGTGGVGGRGGNGGATSAVVFKDRDDHFAPPRTSVPLKGGCQMKCEASVRPAGVTGPVGVIAISGNAGCAGTGGGGGGGGPGGQMSAGFGPQGHAGGPGTPGVCTALPAWH